MRAPPWLLLILCVTASRALAVAAPPLADLDRCEAANHAAAARHGIPAGLLEAIGRVESGRRGPDGEVRAWPWTIDVQGDGSFLAGKPEAIEAVQAHQARGAQSIDVGCDQINLLAHPDAFATLADAFDPESNADYAARFLVLLHERTNDWAAAAALYHSADPAEGGAYRQRVLAAWAEAPAAAGAHLPLAPRPFAAFDPHDVIHLITMPGHGVMQPGPQPWPHASLAAGAGAALRGQPFPASTLAGVTRAGFAPSPATSQGRDLAAYRIVPIEVARGLPRTGPG